MTSDFESGPDPSPGLSEADPDPDPIVQCGRWYGTARAKAGGEPNAVALATASADGAPSVRMVLLKHFDPRGFVFYTSYSSRKGFDIESNPRAALAFYWEELDRQVRIEGRVERVAAAESDAYFDTRPMGSRLGAAASPQSRVIESRAALERRVQELIERHRHGRLPRPTDWGGYRVVPETFEFWQGRRNRLHDRLRYRRAGAARVSVVADSCNPIELTRREWEQVARDANAPYLDIEVICSDAREHRERVETRASTVEGLRLPTWAEVERREYHDWTVERIVIDTSRKPQGECLNELLSRLSGEAA